MALGLEQLTTAAFLLNGTQRGRGFFTNEYLANKQYATWFFGAQSPGQYMYAVPRYKYMFYANFVVNSQAAVLYPWLRELGGQNGISFKIKNIDKPNVELTQRELNQYNRKRYAYTKTDYKPVTVNIYDTVDNKPLDVWRQYFTYYFGDARQKSQLIMDQSTVQGQFLDSTGWGLRPLGEQTNFFLQLDLYAIWGLRYTRVSYLNPKIMNINWQSFDTSDSGLTDLQMTLSYETLRYDPSAEITPAIAAQFGFDVGPPVPEPDVSVSGTILRSAVGIVDSLVAQRDADTGSFGSILGTAASVISNFGLSQSSYNSFTRTGGGPGYGFATPTGQAIPNQITYSSATAAFDNYNAETDISNYGSDFMGGEQMIDGLPDGQLPDNTGSLDGLPDSFQTTGGNNSQSTLGSYGDYNFGSGGFQGGPYAGANAGPLNDIGDAGDYRYGGFAGGPNAGANAGGLQTGGSIYGGGPLAGATDSMQIYPGAYSPSPGGDPRVTGYDQPQYDALGNFTGYYGSDVGGYSVTGGEAPNRGFTTVPGDPRVDGFSVTGGGSSNIPRYNDSPEYDPLGNFTGYGSDSYSSIPYQPAPPATAPPAADYDYSSDNPFNGFNLF